VRVFQSTYKDRNGKTQKTDRWYVQLQDHLGVCRRIPGFTDRKATEALGRSIERLVRFKVSGETLDQALTKWVEGLNPKLRENLARIGLLDAGKVAALRPLMEHVNGTDDAPGWRQFLAAKGNTAEHVKRFTDRCRRAFEGCRAVYWSDLSATRLMTWLDGQRADVVDANGKVKRGFGAHAVNGFITALNGFGRWMVREGRASENPMVGLRKLNAKTDKRHPRRPYAIDELRWLLDVTRKGPERFGMTGVERAMLYRVAAETGLRSNELRSLTRASFVLDGERLGVTVRAGYSKRRRDDVLPVRADTAVELRDFLSCKLPGAQVFTMPPGYDVSDMLKADLADARVVWLNDASSPQERAKREGTSFLCYVDSAGRYADFHALRHTCGSLLAASGVHPKVAQSLMRHSDINLTMSLYTHTLASQEADAVAALPSLDVPPIVQHAKATGTDNVQAFDNAATSALTTTATGADKTDNAQGKNAQAKAGDAQAKSGDSVLAMRLAHRGGKGRISTDSCEGNVTIVEDAKSGENIGKIACFCGKTGEKSKADLGSRTQNLGFTNGLKTGLAILCHQ